MAYFSISSPDQECKSSNKALYDFLIDFRNFKSILPEDKVEGFTCDDNSCSFNIKGITPLKVILAEKIPYSKIVYHSEGLGKFNFILKVDFSVNAGQSGSSKIELSGDLNPFIKAMAEKPLTALVNSMNQKLSELIV